MVWYTTNLKWYLRVSAPGLDTWSGYALLLCSWRTTPWLCKCWTQKCSKILFVYLVLLKDHLADPLDPLSNFGAACLMMSAETCICRSQSAICAVERSVVQGKMFSPLPLAIPINEMEVATWKSKLVPQPFQDPQSYPFQPSRNHPSKLDWTLGQRAGSRIRDRPSCSLPHRPGTWHVYHCGTKCVWPTYYSVLQ